MTRSIPPLTLLPRQARWINASEGVRLEVLSGCLWLTRPDDAEDHFLVAGSHMELHGKHVLIQSDKTPGADLPSASTYRLTPIASLQRPAFLALSSILRLKNWRYQTPMPMVMAITAKLIKP